MFLYRVATLDIEVEKSKVEHSDILLLIKLISRRGKKRESVKLE